MARTKSKRIIFYSLIGLVLALVVFLLIGLQNDLSRTEYKLDAPAITKPIRIAILTDLHGQAYGLQQKDLLAEVEAGNPDLVLLVGDIIDENMPEEPAWTAMQNLSSRYPTYYVSGNHEIWTGDVERIKAEIRALGIEVLEGDVHTRTIRGQSLTLLGLDDPDISEEIYYAQIQEIEEQLPRSERSDFTILLSHRPEEVFGMDSLDFDLAIAGHAHGGQWRIPGILPGLFSPNQGMFPDYTSGFYEVGKGKKLLVSRGLSKDSTRVPRIYNPPEILLLEIY